MSQNSELIFRNNRIRQDEYGNICLNDLWELTGKPKNNRPRDWYPSKRAKALDKALNKRIAENSRNSREKPEKSTYYVQGKGRASITFAHAVLALDYADYLDASLAVEIREVFLRYRSNDLTLAIEIIENLSDQVEYDEKRIDLRNLVRQHNKESAGTAKHAGVTDFPGYNGAGVSGLYGGMTAGDVLAHKGLPQDANRLDHAGHEELAANYFKATQAVAKLRREKIKGQDAANRAHEEVGKAVRKTIKEIGGTMPEDEPALDNIRDAKKRIKSNRDLLDSQKNV